jgi:hypothetical protein
VTVFALTLDRNTAGIIFAVVAFLVGFAAVRFAKKTRGGRAFGIPITYADGKMVREWRPNDMLIMAALVVGFGGFCIWALFHFFA